MTGLRATHLHADMLSAAGLLQQPAAWRTSVLGALCFSAARVEPPPQLAHGVPRKPVAMRRLDADGAACEVLRSSGSMIYGQHGGIAYGYDDNFLFGVIALPESDFTARTGHTALQQATTESYTQIFDFIEYFKFPWLFRYWNYIADINCVTHGLERYRQFNLGRQDAYLARGGVVDESFPAACALGMAEGPLTIAFLAGRVAPMRIENPRQVSAYHYPAQYGPRSPMFSRASLVRLPHSDVLFISGTASVVGHKTLHPGDVLAQTRETVANLKAVLVEANRAASRPDFDLAGLQYKVYVRRPADFALIRDELTRSVGDSLNAVYLHADVCRQDLLLEIEATGVLPARAD